MNLYIYYCLALQKWCSTDYKIHGLWPDYNADSYPSYCSDTPFNLAELQQSPKYESMLENWYDCTYNDTISLYEHEWLKHGTCVAAQIGYSQNEYFEKVLELFDTYKELDVDKICFNLDFERISCDTEYASNPSVHVPSPVS
jgi:ribonuclease I